MSEYPILTLITTLAGALFVYNLWKWQAPPKIKLPPGPKTYPLVGHLFSMPSEYEHLAFTELGKQLGSSIFSLSTFGTTIVVLNDAQDATNLLERRSAIYSDRSCPPMIAEPSLFEWRKFGALVGYNDRWKKYRRLMNHWLHKKVADDFRPLQTEEARLLLKRLLDECRGYDSSEGLADQVFRAAASTIFRSVYGYQLNGRDDPFLVGTKTAIDNLTKASLPSNFLVNVIPALVNVPDWFPSTGWKKIAREWRQQKDGIVQATYEWAKAKHVDGTGEQTIIGTMMEQAPAMDIKEEETDNYLQEIAITLMAGGTDTISSTLMGFFLAMVLFPEAKVKAQKEIDALIGLDRMPNLEDQTRLPFITRVVQETLRWLPATPLAIPHVCFQDDVYQGYNIPKGTIVIGNVWAMTRDPKVYRNPENFDPDRFLDPLVPHAPGFGWGRRQCPGVHVAQASLFIFITSFLATFDIEMAKDHNGEDIIPSNKIANAFVIHPEPFKCRITPRSEAHEALIRAAI